MASELSLLQSQLVQLRNKIATEQASLQKLEAEIVEGQKAYNELHANTVAAERALQNSNLPEIKRNELQGIYETNKVAEATQLAYLNDAKIQYSVQQGNIAALKQQYTSLENQIRELTSAQDPRTTTTTIIPADYPNDPAGVKVDPLDEPTITLNADEYGANYSPYDEISLARQDLLLAQSIQTNPDSPDNVQRQLEIDTLASNEAKYGANTTIGGLTLEEIRRNGIGATNGAAPPGKGPTEARVNGLLKDDKRVRISLSPGSGNILYKIPGSLSYPLIETDGLIFPFTPALTISHEARYDQLQPTHSNFAFHFYQNSSIRPISLQGEFVCRTQAEGRYVLGGINFLQSLTKMFTTNDMSDGGISLGGTPPAVARLHGYGISAFDSLPVVVSEVTVTYPDDVDYITILAKPNSTDIVYKLPTTLTIMVQLLPLFSRNFATNDFTVTGFNNGTRRLLGN